MHKLFITNFLFRYLFLLSRTIPCSKYLRDSRSSSFYEIPPYIVFPSISWKIEREIVAIPFVRRTKKEKKNIAVRVLRIKKKNCDYKNCIITLYLGFNKVVSIFISLRVFYIRDAV